METVFALTAVMLIFFTMFCAPDTISIILELQSTGKNWDEEVRAKASDVYRTR